MNVRPNVESSSEFRRVDRWSLVGLLLITGLAFLVRVHTLDAESLWMDELAQVSTYSLPFHQVVRATADPFDYVIGACLDRLGLAGSDWWVRFPAAAFGTASVFLFGWMIARIAGGGAGLAAAMLLSVCPLHVAMSQEVRPYITYFFLVLFCLPVFCWARSDPAFRRWLVLAFVLLAILMARWFDAEVFTLLVLAYSCAAYVVNRQHDPGAEPREKRKLFGTLVALLAAYAMYNPLAGLILVRTWSWAQGEREAWLPRWGHLLVQGWQAIFRGGADASALTSALQFWLCILLTGAALVGVAILFSRIWRERRALSTLFAVVAVGYPLAFAAIYGRLVAWPLKPQYLLLLSMALFGGLAVAADGLRLRLLRARPVAAWLSFGAVLALAVIPMARVSIEALYRQEKADWRGVLSYLREHCAAGDAIASVRPHWSRNSMGAYVSGADRYFPGHPRILRVEFDTPLERLESPPWSRAGNKVWLICNKAAQAEELLPTPLAPVRSIRIHDFHMLFLLEVAGEGSGAERLMQGLAFLDQGLPDRRGLVAPNLLRLRYYLALGDYDRAEASIASARRHCRNQADAFELDVGYAAMRGDTALPRKEGGREQAAAMSAIEGRPF
ncbi:MAG TPA: hypothetical protein VMV94_14870 [Phycisphaerae bacterium]|nr:hypothetical protein [Phycisphaerae bacterium]